MAAKRSFGTTLTYNGAVIAKLTQIGGVKITRESFDSTTHQSTDGFREYLPGLADAGEVPISGLMDYTDTAGQLAMAADAVADPAVLRTCVITAPTATGLTWTFSAFLSEFQLLDGPMDGLIPFSASLKISGKPTLGTATSAGLTTPFFTVNNSGVIAPVAAQATTEYVVTFLTGVTSVVITPTATAGVITITANGVTQTVATGVAASAIALGAAGSITNATITVTETGKAPKVYTLHLTRA